MKQADNWDVFSSDSEEVLRLLKIQVYLPEFEGKV